MTLEQSSVKYELYLRYMSDASSAENTDLESLGDSFDLRSDI